MRGSNWSRAASSPRLQARSSAVTGVAVTGFILVRRRRPSLGSPARPSQSPGPRHTSHPRGLLESGPEESMSSPPPRKASAPAAAVEPPFDVIPLLLSRKVITAEQAERARRAARINNVTVEDRKSTRLNSSHLGISYAVFCLKKKTKLI